MLSEKAKEWLRKPSVSVAIHPLVVGFACAILAALLSLTMTNTYRSEISLLPVESKGVGGLSLTAAALGLSIPGQDGADANFVEILNSRWLKESILKTEFTYHLRKGMFGRTKEYHGNLLAYLNAKNVDRGIQSFGTVMSVNKDLKTRLLTITVETKSPELSRQVAQQAFRVLGNFVQMKNQTRGYAKARYAEARLKEAMGELAQAENALMVFLEGNRNYSTSSDPMVRVHGMHLEAEYKLRQQLSMTLATSKEQALMEEKNDMPILNLLDDGNLPIEKSGPARSLIVLKTLLISALALFAWEQRKMVFKFIFAK